MPPGQLAIAIRPNEENPAAGQFARHKLQQQQRGLIRPVEIIQDQDQRLTGCSGLEECGDRVEEPEAGGVRVINTLRGHYLW